MELKDTIELMNSSDYKERFRGEYLQTKIRYNKLHATIIKAHAGTLPFKLDSGVALLEEQARYMGMYLKVLEIRAEKENINLL